MPRAATSDSPQTIAYELQPRAGQRLNEYELLEPIGRGGMGLVYRARHVRLQRIVAVKVLPQMALADESAIIRMQRETAAAGRVQHPNIVYATDAGQCEGVHYLVMEYVQGLDLSKLVASIGQLPVAEACEIVRQAALGLGHIAECGLVHRDLKPSNLMLAADGSVKILDLGLALLHHNPLDDYEATQPGYLLGTADYIAPEQIDAPHEVDVRSDLYSLGCTLYKLLTGVAPFSSPEQNSVDRKVEAHRHKPPPAVGALRPNVPGEIERLMAQLLAKRPADRFQRPEQLARALAPLARGADLPGLARRLRETGALNVPPLVDELGTPHGTPGDSDATTHSIARSETPRPLAAVIRSLPTWVKLTAVVALVMTMLAIAAWLTPDRGERPGYISPPPIPSLQPRKGRVIYDLSKPLKEYRYVGWEESPPPVFNDNMLQVEPWTHQLIEIGQYDGQPGTFSVTMSQARWHGMAGIYFGCRRKPMPNQPELGRPALTTFQLFEFQYFPSVRGVSQFSLLRQPAILPVSTSPHIRHDPARLYAAVAETFNAPPSELIRVDITFGKDGDGRTCCQRVTVNDQELPRLTTKKLNALYLPEDYHGPFGLYANKSEKQPGPKWFGNVVFTSSEN